MKNTARFQTPGGDITLTIDIDTEGTHRQVREAIERVFADAVESIKRRAVAKASNAKFKVGSQTVRMKDTFSTFRIKARGKNITGKTDKFGVAIGDGVYPDTPKKLPVGSLAKAAHIELGTVKNAPKPSLYPAFDETRAEILAELDGLI